jgi:hypothetical protein
MRIFLPQAGPTIRIDRKKFAIEAGGPGSGRHPYGQLPPSFPSYQAKLMPKDNSWLKHSNWRKQAFGGILVNQHGQFLLREPSGHFDGYTFTFPKGKMDHPNESPVDVAHREVQEETGIRGRIFDRLPGTFTSQSGAYNNFYLMKPVEYVPHKMDKETWSTRWADYDTAKKLIGMSKNVSGRARDLAILEHAHQHLLKYNH